MKGFVPTPAAIVDIMVAKLFRGAEPRSRATVLDPGCGEGEFIAGIIRWCKAEQHPLPRIVGIEADSTRAATARARFADIPEVEIRTADFLCPFDQRFDFIVANPPYVPITELSVAERDAYRRVYATANGRFDLYLLFFEQALRLLTEDGRLVFITPEKFLYVDTASPLREMLLRRHIEELHFLAETTFADLVTYPLVSTISARQSRRTTRIIHRNGHTADVHLEFRSSWLPVVLGHERRASETRLLDACVRVSCGVATGADSVYVIPDAELPVELTPYAYPTIAGRQIREGEPLQLRSSMLMPYDREGTILPEQSLGTLGVYLNESSRRDRLLRRTCATRRKWYAFHENPPMRDLLRPKVICKDITASPFFVVDPDGCIIPRHSTYYIVPSDPSTMDELATYLNSPASRDWLRAHCQRAANGFLRLQSHVLKQLPIPASLASEEMDQSLFAEFALPA
ncbi:MAG: class I SAM-dependent methyltransferase [Gemmatimonadaceae bacterium]